MMTANIHYIPSYKNSASQVEGDCAPLLQWGGLSQQNTSNIHNGSALTDCLVCSNPQETNFAFCLLELSQARCELG